MDIKRVTAYQSKCELKPWKDNKHHDHNDLKFLHPSDVFIHFKMFCLQLISLYVIHHQATAARSNKPPPPPHFEDMFHYRNLYRATLLMMMLSETSHCSSPAIRNACPNKIQERKNMKIYKIHRK